MATIDQHACRSLPLLLLLAGCCCLLADETFASSAPYEFCLQSLGGQVGGGNYSYYRLAQEGEVALSLRSVIGDADIYLSEVTLQPTWETNDHDLRSATCGEDRVDIPAHFQRPIGIGIYGHPSHDLSVYRLCVNLKPAVAVDTVLPDDRDYDYNSYNDEDYAERSSPHNTQVPFRGGGYDKEAGGEEESLLWTIVIGILKIIIEVFM